MVWNDFLLSAQTRGASRPGIFLSMRTKGYLLIISLLKTSMFPDGSRGYTIIPFEPRVITSFIISFSRSGLSAELWNVTKNPLRLAISSTPLRISEAKSPFVGSTRDMNEGPFETNLSSVDVKSTSQT